ncbi:sensor histidine kinase [Kineococcus sp. SYSU DK005]|uniref:sensor histidine kinase n=1 Tax=Kineococcus sp. SYSU DK005 TaxID=3383126 RepID=UPI003D7E71E0
MSAPPAGTAPRAASPRELRSLFLFEHLDEQQLARFAAAGTVEHVAPGWLYREGAPARSFFVLLDGAVSLHRRVGGDDVEIGRTRQRGVYAGAWEAYLGEGAPGVYTSSLRVLEPASVFALPAAEFGAAVREWFPMAVHLLEGLRLGITEAQELVSARERLLALGSLTAGLTHELGNPAAALSRTVVQLQAQVDALASGLLRLVPGGDALAAGLARARAAAAPPAGDVLARADAEDALLERLEDAGVAEPDAGDLAAVLADAGVGEEDLDAFAGAAGAGGVPARGALPWLARSLAVESLLGEAAAASARISSLLASAGRYAQLDRAPTRWVDVRELLDDSVAMLGAGAGRAPGGARIVRDYAEDVPQVLGHAGELAQVWTNLLDNALDALAGAGATAPPGAGRDPGTVVLRVRADDGGRAVVVEVDDDGPGVPPEVLPRVFEPFVTTKDVGEGTGLGLDIAWRVVVQRHRGTLSVTSVPGRTVFRARLPVDPDQTDQPDQSDQSAPPDQTVPGGSAP